MIWTRPVVQVVSQATRAPGSFSRMASRIASEIWSQILSGCPSVTDSDVNRNLDIRCLLGEMPCGGKMRGQKGNLPKTKARPPCRGTESALIAYLPVSRRTWHLTLRAGCRASQGLFPQPLLISCYSDVGDYLTTESCSCQRFFAGQFGCFAQNPSALQAGLPTRPCRTGESGL